MGALTQLGVLLLKNFYTLLSTGQVSTEFITVGLMYLLAIAYKRDDFQSNVSPIAEAAEDPQQGFFKSVVYGPPSTYSNFIAEEAFQYGDKEKHHYVTRSSLEGVQKSCRRGQGCFYLHSDGTTNGINYTVVESGPNTSTIGVRARVDAAHLAWAIQKIGQQPPTPSDEISRKTLIRHFGTPGPPDLQLNIYIWIYATAPLFIPFCVFVTNIASDTESGIKGMLHVFGVPRYMFWLCHLSVCYVLTTCRNLYLTFLLTRFFVPSYNDTGPLCITMFLYTGLFVMHTIFVGCLFNKMIAAMVFSVIYWIALVAYPYTVFEGSLITYLHAPRYLKLILCCTPTVGTYMALIILTTPEYEGAVPSVTGYWNGYDNITLQEIWIIMVISSVVLALFIWYFTNVLPWIAPNPRPLWFPFMSSYWQPYTYIGPDSPVPEQTGDYFQPNLEATPVIAVRQLQKNYGDKVAVDNVSVNFYEKEITALIGKSGAGKTSLINILAGVSYPTDGTAYIYGYDVTSESRDALSFLSFCPQDDVFFRDLTVKRNLLFVGLLKGLKRQVLMKEVDSVLKVARLKKKKNRRPTSLAAGQKRRLSIAIALMGSPKVMILDEPTNGVDMKSKQKLWDLFQSMRQDTTILLSTSDMQEAETLANRIAILAAGKLRCYATPTFLRAAFGLGYQMQIEKLGTAKGNDILTLVRKIAPEAKVTSENDKEMKIALRTTDPKGFDRMFAALEAHSKALRVGKTGVTVVTMEDVLATVGSGDVIEGATDDDLERVSIPSRGSCPPSLQLRALLLKRSSLLSQNWLIVVLSFAMVIILTRIVAAYDHNMYENIAASRNSSTTYSEPVDFSPTGDSFLHYLPEREEFATAYYAPVLKEASINLRVFDDEDTILAELARSDRQLPYVFGGSMVRHPNDSDPYRLVAWWNTSQVHRSLSLANTALLRFITSDESARIVLNIWHGRECLTTNLQDPCFVIEDKYDNILKLLFLPWAIAVAASMNVPCIMMERDSRCMSLQLMCGISSTLYWFSNLLFDSTVFIAMFLVGFIVYGFYTDTFAVTKVAGIVALLPIAVLSTCMSYLLVPGELDKKKDRIYSRAVLALLLLFAVGGTIFLFLHEHVADIKSSALTSLFFLVPFFLAPHTLMKISSIDFANHECIAVRDWKAEYRELRQACEGAVSSRLQYCCKQLVANKTGQEVLVDPFHFHYGIGGELLMMSLLGIVLLLFLSRMYASGAVWDTVGQNVTFTDSQAESEYALVEQLYAKSVYDDYGLVTYRLRKKYDDLAAVNGLSVAVRPNQCLCVLGGANAGKTTVLQMLSGLVNPSSGDAFMADIALSKDQQQWQTHVGYCVEKGGFLEQLSGYENLWLFARLRGVPEEDIPALATSMARLLGFAEYADDVASLYSVGNQRKLAVAVAMIGLPQLLLLDEPTANVDAAARKKILSHVNAMKVHAGISVILCSRNVEDYQIICDRVVVLVKGSVHCLCTLDQLRQRVVAGFTVQVKLTPAQKPLKNEVESAVLDEFPEMKLVDYSKGLFVFECQRTIPWSRVFRRILKLHRRYDFMYVYVSDTTLEKYFVRATHGKFKKQQAYAVPPAPAARRRSSQESGPLSTRRGSVASLSTLRTGSPKKTLEAAKSAMDTAKI
ncbi:ATP-binding cassette sub-family A member 7-like [Ornithodoros turicata]|uniref:ATP-binding cassette sub-family A member 7-like n=1 Tax=Ornithodoros turicata TaxID=34597 RepID=UPI003138BC9F